MEMPGLTPHPAAPGELRRAVFAARDGEDPLDLGERRRWRTEPAPDRSPRYRRMGIRDHPGGRLDPAGFYKKRVTELVEQVGFGS